jgi:arylsulfatase A-like enzyme
MDVVAPPDIPLRRLRFLNVVTFSLLNVVWNRAQGLPVGSRGLSRVASMNDSRRLLFRPTWWLGLGVLSLWLFRALSLHAAEAFGEEVATADYLAFGWDLALAAGLFELARLAVHPELSARPRLHLFMRYGAFSLFILCDDFVRAADLLNCTLTGRHFSAGAFIYMSPANLTLLRDGHSPIAVYALVGATAAYILALVLDGRSHRRRVAAAPPSIPSSSEHVPAFIAVLAIALPLGSGFWASETATARFVPESVFLRQWLVYRGVITPADAAQLDLPNGLERKLVKLGLAPEQPLDPRYPLLHARLDSTPFPYPKTAAAGNGPPNVVFTLVETLNHEFVNAFSGELPGLMPQVSALAQRVTMVTDYRSITTPTIHALVASLCSIHGALPYVELNKRRVGDAMETTRMMCLPEILRAHGYRTVYIQAGSNRFAGTEGFLKAHGFDETIGAQQLEPMYPERERSHWGVHDDTLVEFAENKIRELEAQRAQGGPPFFVMVQTIDMHAPGQPPLSCAMPDELRNVSRDPDSRTMMHAVHCTDAALGELGRFILDDPARADSTLWALTGDHPSVPMAFLNDLHAKHHDRFGEWSGRLPLLLHDPTHALPQRVPVLSGHLDLAPTLLHILGIVDQKNAMEGLSIFGQRPKHPVLLGRRAPDDVAIYRPGHTHSLSVEHLVKLCDGRHTLLHGDEQALNSCELLAWLRWQNALWKYNRIFPDAAPAPAP